jgi:hypothetical protein
VNGSLSINLDTIGHSEVCHLIQDCALEYQFFELIINLASLQPIAEDRLETEDLSLRQAPAMIVAPSSLHLTQIRATKPFIYILLVVESLVNYRVEARMPFNP